GVERRVAIDDLERVTVVVARHVEPRIAVEVREIDDERVAFITTARKSHPGRIVLRYRHTAVDGNDALLVRPLVYEGHVVRRLDDLKRPPQIRHARNAWEIALRERIGVL